MLNRLYGWYGKRVVWGVLAAIAILVVLVIFSRGEPIAAEPEQTVSLPAVTVRKVSALSGMSEFRVVGTVRALSEARLETEAGGRVTAVNVSLGDEIAAGTIIASLENSRERAALLQAEAAYESAEAALLQNTSSLEEAARGVRNAYRNAYTVVDDVTRSTIDDFFTNPDKPFIGFRLRGGDTAAMNATRRSIEDMLTAWSLDIANNFANRTEAELLSRAQTNLELVSNFVITLSTLVENDKNQDYNNATDRDELVSARGSLDAALTSLARARQTYEQASLTTSNAQASQSSALLRSALATVRGAEANYERTLVRSPISGVVNALYLKTGEYVGQGQPAAVVANNNALEISTALGEADLERVTIGDTVTIDAGATGVVAKVAPAIDPLTGKGEVLVSVTSGASLTNGATVGVTFTRANVVADATGPITVPLTALRLLPTGPIAYTVSTDGVLVALPVTLGEIVGDMVTVLEGLSADTEIITDARGRRAGETVVVTQ